jgi:hypothetical protein
MNDGHTTLKTIRHYLSMAVVVFATMTFCGLPLNAFAAQHSTKLASAVNLLGQPSNPFQEDNLATVLIFVTVDCPISNKYAPEIQRLRGLFEKKNIAFWIVYPDGDIPISEIRQHVQDYALGDKILRDPDHVLVKKAHATITPQAAIFDHNRKLVYTGRIDDRFAALGQQRSQPTIKDLEQNLNCVLENKPISPKTTKSIGCHISGLN